MLATRVSGYLAEDLVEWSVRKYYYNAFYEMDELLFIIYWSVQQPRLSTSSVII